MKSTPSFKAEGITTDQIISQILQDVPKDAVAVGA